MRNKKKQAVKPPKFTEEEHYYIVPFYRFLADKHNFSKSYIRALIKGYREPNISIKAFMVIEDAKRILDFMKELESQTYSIGEKFKVFKTK